jgi:hypothetical protein
VRILIDGDLRKVLVTVLDRCHALIQYRAARCWMVHDSAGLTGEQYCRQAQARAQSSGVFHDGYLVRS